MKVALFSLFSLMCFQVALVTCAHISLPDPDRRSSDLVEEKKTELALTCNRNNVLEPEQRVSFLACAKALKDFGSVSWEAWGIFSEKKANASKADKEKLKCHDTTSNAEDLEECLKAAEEEYQKKDTEINVKIAGLVPKIMAVVIGLFSCVF